MISTKNAVEKSEDNCGGNVGKLRITDEGIRQIGCEKIKLEACINFMAAACHLLGARCIHVAEARRGRPCGAGG